MKRIITALAISSACLISPTTLASGIPVLDVAALENAILMYKQLQQQYEQVQKQYDSLNGSRGMAALLGKPELRKYLPNEWKDVYTKVKNGDYSGISEATKSAKEENKVITDDEWEKLPPGKSMRIDKMRDSAAMSKGFAEESYKHSGERIQRLQEMIDSIDESTDPKAIMDLQASIQAEQAMLQNENMRIQLLAQLQEAEAKLEAQQSRERFLKTSGAGSANVKVRCPIRACQAARMQMQSE